ncbi:MAG TPA: hypothetical protein VFQ88_15225 [Nevskiaceae bacterium]|nr:hypothetical protein [Nevskiaceae bacterium]
MVDGPGADRISTGRNATNTMLCWGPAPDHVALVDWPDYRRVSDPYTSTALACDSGINTANFGVRKLAVFLTAWQAVVRDRMDPMAMHRVLLGLDEYRDGCAADMPGMEVALTPDAERMFDCAYTRAPPAPSAFAVKLTLLYSPRTPGVARRYGLARPFDLTVEPDDIPPELLDLFNLLIADGPNCTNRTLIVTTKGKVKVAWMEDWVDGHPFSAESPDVDGLTDALWRVFERSISRQQHRTPEPRPPTAEELELEAERAIVAQAPSETVVLVADEDGNRVTDWLPPAEELAALPNVMPGSRDLRLADGDFMPRTSVEFNEGPGVLSAYVPDPPQFRDGSRLLHCVRVTVPLIPTCDPTSPDAAHVLDVLQHRREQSLTAVEEGLAYASAAAGKHRAYHAEQAALVLAAAPHVSAALATLPDSKERNDIATSLAAFIAEVQKRGWSRERFPATNACVHLLRRAVCLSAGWRPDLEWSATGFSYNGCVYVKHTDLTPDEIDAIESVRASHPVPWDGAQVSVGCARVRYVHLPKGVKRYARVVYARLDCGFAYAAIASTVQPLQ